MNPDEVLAHIDHALDDREVGPDAMRWTPQPAPTQTMVDPEALERARRRVEERMQSSVAAIDWSGLVRQLGAMQRAAHCASRRLGGNAE